MGNSGRQTVTQKVALGRASLVVTSTLAALEESTDKFIAALAKQSGIIEARLAKELNASSNTVTRLTNSTRVGYRVLQRVADRASDAPLERAVAINAIDLADFFLREFKSRPDRKKIDLIALIREPLRPRDEHGLTSFDLGPVEPHKWTFKLGQIVEIDGQKYRIKSFNPIADGVETLRLEIDSGQAEASSL